MPIVAEFLPVHVVGPVVQLDRPRAAGDGIIVAHTLAHLVDGEVMAALDPTCHADAGLAVDADSGAREGGGVFVPEEAQQAIGLVAAVERHARRGQRIERRGDVRHVHQRAVVAEGGEQEPSWRRRP